MISLDKDQVLTCPDLRRIEDVGPDERTVMADSIYNMGVAKGVFEVVNNNKAMADLKRNRAQEFFREVEKSSPKQFYGRFNMLLHHKLKESNGNIAGDFSVKWGTIKECLFGAISDEQGVSRMTNFLALNHTKFSEAPLELLVNMVDRDVDTFLGNSSDVFRDSKKRQHCLLTHNLLTKYEIIFDIVRNLDSKFTLLKECVLKELSKFYFDPKTILDIPDLQKHLYSKLDAKSLSTLYRQEPVHVARKLPVQTAEFSSQPGSGKWSEEETLKFKKAWEESKKGIPNSKDDAIKNELVTLIRGLGCSKELEDTYVKEHKDVKECMDKAGYRFCFSPNCNEKSILARKIGMNFNPRSDFSRKKGWLKFSGVKDNLKLTTEIKGRRPPKKLKLPTKVTTITVKDQTSPIVINQLDKFMEEDVEDLEYGFVPCPSFNMKAKVLFSEANLPDTVAWRADPDTEDKSCPICYWGEMDLGEMRMHLITEQDLLMDSPLCEWQAVKEDYGTDSEDEEETEEATEIPSSTYNQLHEARTARDSDSNQDSSSELVVSSRSGSRRRRRQKRNRTSASDVTEVVEAAIKKNMNSFKLDFENELGIINSEMSTLRNEMEKLDSGINDISVNVIRSTHRHDEVMQEVSNDIRKLSTVKKDGLADLEKIPQLITDSSKYADILSSMAACQKKQNSVIDTNSSSLIELKNQLKAAQVLSKTNYDSAMEIYNSTQAERKEKLNSVENGQVEIIELLSSLKTNNEKVQERLEALETKTGATASVDTQGGATIKGINCTIPPTASNSTKEECSNLEANARKLAVTVSKDKIEDTLLTTVLNPPVNDAISHKQPQFNQKNKITNYFYSISLSGPGAIRGLSEAKEKKKVEAQSEDTQEVEAKSEVKKKEARRLKVRMKMKDRRVHSPTYSNPSSSPRPKPGMSPSWMSKIGDFLSGFSNNSPNILWGILILFAALTTGTHAATNQASPALSFLSSLQSSQYRTVYPLLEMETRTWAYELEEVQEAAFSIVDDACYYLQVIDELCEAHPSSCQTSHLSLENFKKGMDKAFEVIFSLQRICDVGTQPSSEFAKEQCRKGKEWRELDAINENFMFLDSLLESFTPDFLDAKKTSHRGHRSIQWTSALVDIAARNLANLPPTVQTRME